MSIIQEIKALEPDARELRKFSWTVGVAFLLLCFVLAVPLPYFWGKGGFYSLLAWIGGGLIAVGTVFPSLVKPFYFAWMSMAVVLGFVMTRVILTLFFAIVLVPVGLFFRLIGRDALTRRIDRQASTYWIDKVYAIPDRSRLEKFF